MAQLKAIASRVGTRRGLTAVAAILIAAAGAGSFLAVHAATSGPNAGGQLAAASLPAGTATAATAPGAARFHGRRPLLLALVRATVKETGLTAKTVRQDLQSGQTLDQIAGSKAGAVETDVLNAITTRLDRARKNGRITQQQETDRLAKAKTRIEMLMSTPLKIHAAAAATA